MQYFQPSIFNFSITPTHRTDCITKTIPNTKEIINKKGSYNSFFGVTIIFLKIWIDLAFLTSAFNIKVCYIYLCNRGNRFKKSTLDIFNHDLQILTISPRQSKITHPFRRHFSKIRFPCPAERVGKTTTCSFLQYYTKWFQVQAKYSFQQREVLLNNIQPSIDGKINYIH